MSASGSPFHQLADSFMTSLCDDEPSFYLDPKLEPVSPEVNIDCRKTYATLEPAASKAEPQRHLSESSDSSGYLSNPEMPGHLLYPAMDRETDTDLRAWVNLHPSNWTSFEVLDWVYYVAENMGDNGCDVRGEKFNNMTGQNLLQMTRVDFEGLDDRYGSLLHESFQAIMKNSHFIRPEGFDVMMPKHESSPLPSIKNLLVPNNWHGGEGYNDRNTTPSMQELGEILNTLGNNKFSPEELMVQIGPSMYSIDGTDCFMDISPLEGIVGGGNDTGYDSESTESSESMDSSDSNAALALTTSLPACPAPDQNANIPLCVQDPSMVNEPSAPALNHTKPKGKVGRPRKVRPPGEDGPKVPGQRGRKLGQGTKGNHLWEFIRDLLFDPTHNPKIIKWEDEEDKVFRIVQSEQVAKLWGKKKNNPNMTYEKLSRALRHYYKTGILKQVNGRLLYKFMSKACFAGCANPMIPMAMERQLFSQHPLCDWTF